MSHDERQSVHWGATVTRPQLGNALRRVREARAVAQVDLADAAGVQRSTISAVENSQRSSNIETLMRICDALDIEICLRDRRRRDRCSPQPRYTAATRASAAMNDDLEVMPPCDASGHAHGFCRYDGFGAVNTMGTW